MIRHMLTKDAVRDFLNKHQKEKDRVGYIGSGWYRIGDGAFTTEKGWKQFLKTLQETALKAIEKEKKESR